MGEVDKGGRVRSWWEVSSCDIGGVNWDGWMDGWRRRDQTLSGVLASHRRRVERKKNQTRQKKKKKGTTALGRTRVSPRDYGLE